MKTPSFTAVFKALHGVEPFPWQRRLADAVVSSGKWPNLALPTAAGKTSAIDVALYHLALEADTPSHERKAPRRILFVVDRRTVVDDAYRRALRIARKLEEPSDKAEIQWLRSQLLKHGGTQPLATAMLRGGVYRDQQWFKDPLQPTVIVSTVDQVGSRLLFRGYGCRSEAWPIHAALVATDALVLLDEAHLSQPFEQTLEAVQLRIQEDHRRNGWGLPLQKASLTATSAASAPPMREDDEDRAHPVLSVRLSTPKPCLLIKVATERIKADLKPQERRQVVQANRQKMAEEFLRVAKAFAAASLPKKIAIIVNEVALARLVHELLVAASQNSFLVIGRSRPVDRWNLFDATEAPMQQVRVGSPPLAVGGKCLFVVSTQCIEVGADLDFDHLITECAAIDALRQRFGRLARLGRSHPSHAVIIGSKGQVAGGVIHPVYGEALGATWDWLSSKARKGAHPLGKGPVIDFSHASLTPLLPSGEALAKLLTPREDAPLLLDHHLECWNQTHPKPAAEPEVALFLHGPSKGPPEINVVWRDLPKDATASWADWVEVLRPVSAESLQLPLHQLIQWLKSRAEEDCFDAPAEETEEGRDDTKEDLPFPLLRLRPDSEPVLCQSFEDVRRIRQGETVVLPVSAGGCDRFGWAPRSKDPVVDCSLQAHLLQRRELMVIVDVPEDELPVADSILNQIRNRSTPSPIGVLHRELAIQLASNKTTRWDATALPQSTQMLLTRKGRVPDVRFLDADSEDWEDDRMSRVSSSRIDLLRHLEDVHAEVLRYCKVLGLPKEPSKTLELAAFLHDVGKADPEFQSMLGNADTKGSLLAKGTRVGTGKATRHEALSVDMVATASVKGLQDSDLLLHLIGSHHGRARPFIMTDRGGFQAPEATLRLTLPNKDTVSFSGSQCDRLYRADSGYALRFDDCSKRLGAFHLALLETLLRLADWKVSGSYNGHP